MTKKRGKTVYLTEEQLVLGIEGYYNIMMVLADRGYRMDLDVEDEKALEACRRAIEKLGGRT